MRNLRFFTCALFCTLFAGVFSFDASGKEGYEDVLSSVSYLDLVDDETETTNYTYDKSGRLSKISTIDFIAKIDWSGYKRGKVEMTFSNGRIWRSSVFTLDDKHHAVYITTSEKTYSQNPEVKEYYYQIVYSPSGKLTSITENLVERSAGLGNKKYIPTAKIEYRENSDDASVLTCFETSYNRDGSEVGRSEYKYYLDLTTIDEKGLFGLFLPELGWNELSYAYQAGLLGVSTFYLPNLMEVKTTLDGNVEKSTVVLDWEMNGSGLPFMLRFHDTDSNRGNFVFTWEHRPK